MADTVQSGSPGEREPEASEERPRARTDHLKGKQTFDKIYEGLSAPVPFEYLRTLQKGRGPELTTIQAGYITMTLNYVVGVGGWAFDRSEIHIVEDHKTVEVTLYIADNKGTVVSHTAFGGSRNPGPDGFKSAVTDALTKAASYFGLGEEVFCGKITAADLTKYAARKREIEANTPAPAKKTTKKKTTKKAPKEDDREPLKMSVPNRAKLHHFVSKYFDNGQIEQFLDWVVGKQMKVVGWKTMTNDQAEALLEMVSNKTRIGKAKAAFEKTEGA